jgi:hypothetical protein
LFLESKAESIHCFNSSDEQGHGILYSDSIWLQFRHNIRIGIVAESTSPPTMASIASRLLELHSGASKRRWFVSRSSWRIDDVSGIYLET